MRYARSYRIELIDSKDQSAKHLINQALEIYLKTY